MLTSDQIRQLYLSFFEEKGHKILPSSSLVPHGDPTLLLTSAGMVQFKPYFLGEPLPSGYPPRLTTCQKCFRTTDMDAVGDTKHLTFFEMLGNFSIGDYFKKEAIAWAWEFVTRRLKLPRDRLWITIFLDDDEAFSYWRQQGVPEERIRRFGEKDNFWGPAGETGPCGPCSELHYDLGEAVGCGRPECGPNCDCPRFVEIWNLVFVQYNQDREGKRTPLPRPHIDTGMGLERTAAVMQGKISVYDTDAFSPIIDQLSRLSGKKPGQSQEIDRALRIVAEHARGVAFLIADGVVPANDGRGYVLRRVLRRAALFGRRLGLDKPFLSGVAQQVIDHMGHVYPELVKNREFILKIIQMEEEQFLETSRMGIQLLEEYIAGARLVGQQDLKTLRGVLGPVLQGQFPSDPVTFASQAGSIIQPLRDKLSREYSKTPVDKTYWFRAVNPVDQVLHALWDSTGKEGVAFRAIGESIAHAVAAQIRVEDIRKSFAELENAVLRIPGNVAFELHDTYGFPLDITQDIAREHGFAVDTEGFEAEMERQRERARAARKVVVSDTLKLNEQVITKLALPATEFTGYEQLASPARILSLAVEGRVESLASEGQDVEVVLNRTPFYAEMGGQVADTGEIIGDRGVVQVTDTQWARSDLIIHRGRVTRGALFQDEAVTAKVEEDRRLDIARNHTATHLLQAALRQVLGSPSQAGVQQRGSLVAPDRLRFDYTHLLSLLPEELAQVQGLVNSWVRQNLPVRGQVKPYREAVAQGAIALFGEKYGETVRALHIGDISLELCGGTHLQATGEIGLFIIVSEGSIGSGLRRIEALTGRGAEAFVQGRLATLGSLIKELQATPENVREKLSALQAELNWERKRAQALERELLKKTAEALLSRVESVDGVAVLSARVSASSPESLREMGDWLREGLKSAIIVLGAVYDDRPSFIAMVTPDLVKRGFHAAEIAKQVAKIAGGGGGGRAELAQAGGKDKAKLNEALDAVTGIVRGFSHKAREK